MTEHLSNGPPSRAERWFDGLVARAAGRLAILLVLGIGGFFGKQLLEDVRKLTTNVAVLTTTITLTNSAIVGDVKRLADQFADHEGRIRLVERQPRR